MPPIKDRLPKDLNQLTDQQVKLNLEGLKTTNPEPHLDYLARVLTQSTLKTLAEKVPNPENKVAMMVARATIRDLTAFVEGLPNKELVKQIFGYYVDMLKKKSGGGGGDGQDETILQGP